MSTAARVGKLNIQCPDSVEVDGDPLYPLGIAYCLDDHGRFCLGYRGVLDGVRPKPSFGVNKQLPAVKLLECSVFAAARGESRNGQEGEHRTAQHVSWTIGR